MDPQTVAILVVLLAGAAWLHMRTLARGRRYFLLLWLLAAFLLLRWAGYRDAWLELAVAVTIAGLVIATWWFLRGRHLPAPSDDNIRVWSEEDPFE